MILKEPAEDYIDLRLDEDLALYRETLERAEKAQAERDRLREMIRDMRATQSRDAIDGQATTEEAYETIRVLKAELAKTKRILEIERASAHQFCPDCRDKVKDEPCLRCQKQRAEAERDRLKAMSDRIANSTEGKACLDCGCPSDNGYDGYCIECFGDRVFSRTFGEKP